VHHPAYYSGKNVELVPPADWDEPTPVPFLSATGSYLIALSAPKGCEEWRQAAFDILKLALAEEGVGAKTSSGYGRMTIQER
jgi:CRISPR-associated protein Cmr6